LHYAKMSVGVRSISYLLGATLGVGVSGQFLAAPAVPPAVPVVQPAVHGGIATPHVQVPQGNIGVSSISGAGVLPGARVAAPRVAWDVSALPAWHASDAIGSASAIAQGDVEAYHDRQQVPQPLPAAFALNTQMGFGALLLVGFVIAARLWRKGEARNAPIFEMNNQSAIAQGSFTPTLAAAAFVGESSTKKESTKQRGDKTTAHYTTQVVLPALAWLKSGVKLKDLQPTELIAQVIAGNDVLIGKDESGKLFCVGNLCPHFGTPMSEGADVIGDVIVCPLHGSSFSTKTGELIDWCPTPPIVGPLTGLIVEKKNLLIIDARTGFLNDDIEILVDTNAKKAYAADYWKGILDAQGKNDGTYY
jgi:nitrite reductase/ring-hydroxylating ferredoxin subunit